MQRLLRTIFITGLMLLSALDLQAVLTADYILLTSSAEIVPGGGEAAITVNLVGSAKLYTAYNMDIHLPQGVELVLDSKGMPSVGCPWTTAAASSFYPSQYDENAKQYNYSHVIFSSYGKVGERVLRVACISSLNEQFLAASGALFTFKVKASTYVKPGKIYVDIDNVAFKVPGESQYVTAGETDMNIAVCTTASAEINISATDKYSTCVLPFSTALPTGLRAFSCNATKDDSYLELTPESSIEAYRPYILYAEDGYSGTLSGTVSETLYRDTCKCGYLTGAIEVQKITTGYVLQNHNNGKGMLFYGITGNTEFTIPAGKCWLEIPSGHASYVSMWQTTGIAMHRQHVSTSPVYDVYGRQVNNPKSGTINIVNGRAIINLTK